MAKHNKSQPRKMYLLLFLAIFLFIASQLFTIYVQGIVQENDFRVERLNQEIESLQYENRYFTEEIVKYESFTVIASEAAALGFDQDNELYILK